LIRALHSGQIVRGEYVEGQIIMLARHRALDSKEELLYA
jgi:hypothetical protein